MPKTEETIPDVWALEAAAQCMLTELYKHGFAQPAIAHALRAARAEGYAECQGDIRKLLDGAAADAERRCPDEREPRKGWLKAMARVLRSCIGAIDSGEHVGKGGERGR